jgi:xanthine dehydrogenase large subunit
MSSLHPLLSPEPTAAEAEVQSPSRWVGRPLKHDSALLHVTGRAQYTDDIPMPQGTLHAVFGTSPVAHGELRSLDLAPVLESPGVVAVATHADVPGENNYGAAVHDDPIFAARELCHAGQPVFAVAAESHEAARRAALTARMDIAELPAILDIRTAIAQQSFVLPTQRAKRGDPEGAIAAAPHRLSGTLEIGGQDHFYLEGQVAAALPQDDGSLLVYSSTQHPSECQAIVAHALGVPANRVVVVCRRMGGGFGGKESQPALIAAAAAVLAHKARRPVKLRLDRTADMTITGKRHDFVVDFEVGFDDEGRILGLDVMLASRCGHSADLSGPINDRAMFHLDNAYFIPDIGITSHRCRTHTVSNTAFRGFGGPQGMMVIEAVVDAIARRLDVDPLLIRERNYYGPGRDTTHYGQQVAPVPIQRITSELVASSDYRARREAVRRFNAQGGVIRRGIALTPVKFGISFTNTIFNQAGALLHVYTDGSVLLNHGGTEMGQGLHTKVCQVVATELGVPFDSVRITATDTSKVPNTSATAASSGSDLNGAAARAAAATLRGRLAEFAAARHGVPASSIRFAGGEVHLGDRVIPFAQLVREAYAARISLSATGYYRTPDIHWDAQRWQGRPFYYFAWGAAVAEVALDTLTGESRLLRVDILHDVGSSLNPALDIGQVEGGFLQGAGWLTSETLWWDERGRLRTHAPSTYKIPTARDWPAEAHVRLLADAPNSEATVHRSKAAGEPPLMLAITVHQALRDAVASCGPPGRVVELDAPAHPEALLRAVKKIRGGLS